MPTINALEFFVLGSSAAKIAHSIFFGGARIGSHDLTQFDKDTIKETVIALADLCKRISLPTSLQLLKDRENDPPLTSREWEMLVAAVRAELKTNLFVFVPAHRSKYYDLILQSVITTAFPIASNELVASGDALAVGLYTATVFHAMRAAEIGIRVLGTDLNIVLNKPIETAEWQEILNAMTAPIKAIENMPKSTPNRDDDLQFYSEAAAQFRFFKNAWRIPAAHARGFYEEPEAIKVFDHTLSFFQLLATRLKE